VTGFNDPTCPVCTGLHLGHSLDASRRMLSIARQGTREIASAEPTTVEMSPFTNDVDCCGFEVSTSVNRLSSTVALVQIGAQLAFPHP
jgi:hypothetical protein